MDQISIRVGSQDYLRLLEGVLSVTNGVQMDIISQDPLRIKNGLVLQIVSNNGVGNSRLEIALSPEIVNSFGAKEADMRQAKSSVAAFLEQLQEKLSDKEGGHEVYNHDKHTPNEMSTTETEPPYSNFSSETLSDEQVGKENLIGHAFSEVADELRSSPRWTEPTKYEQLMEIFWAHRDAIVPIEDLVPVFEGTSNPEKSARTSIAYLNAKLEKHGVRIIHRTAYSVASLKEGKSS